MNDTTIDWLLSSDEPWTRYRVLVDLLDRPESDAEVQREREAMLAHPLVQTLISDLTSWPGYALKRHNDAAHPLYALSTLADFGVQAGDPGINEGLQAVLSHQAPEGAFQTRVRLVRQFGGLDGEYWTYMACDAPTLLYGLLAMGLADDERVQNAIRHVLDLVDENGWRCRVAPELGGFRGPGRKDDPCPIANVYALKALSMVPAYLDSPATRSGVESLLDHWQHQSERKIYLFGIGTDFRKIKYPFVWYDILHVVEVLSRYPFIHDDERFVSMLDAFNAQSDNDGRYTAASMYRAWKQWSFADKKHPSPWLTFLALRIKKRLSRKPQMESQNG